MIYVYNPNNPLPTLQEFVLGDTTDTAESYAEQYPDLIYFEYVPEPTERDQLISAIEGLLDVVRDNSVKLDHEAIQTALLHVGDALHHIDN